MELKKIDLATNLEIGMPELAEKDPPLIIKRLSVLMGKSIKEVISLLSVSDNTTCRFYDIAVIDFDSMEVVFATTHFDSIQHINLDYFIDNFNISYTPEGYDKYPYFIMRCYDNNKNLIFNRSNNGMYHFVYTTIKGITPLDLKFEIIYRFF